METLLAFGLVVVLVVAVILAAKYRSERNEAISANSAIPGYREVIERQHERIVQLHRERAASASASELADSLNGLRSDKDDQ